MYGRVMNDLIFQYDPNTVYRGYNNLLQRQLVARVRIPPVSVTGVTTAIFDYAGNVTGINNIVSSVSTVVGLIPGMTVTAQYNGKDLFAKNTVIISIGSVCLSG